jgi:hypothetical protein
MPLDVWFTSTTLQKRISVSAQIKVFADVVVAKNPIGKYKPSKQDVAQVRAEALPNRPASSVDGGRKRELFIRFPYRDWPQ